MKVFLSCVSSEFRSYRLMLANQLGALKGQPYEVKVQEDFEQGGFTLLDRLAEYIRDCDLVIHLVGEACGALPTPEHVHAMFAHLGVPVPEPLLERSYTQWEYDLAIRFDRKMFCYSGTPKALRDCEAPVAQTGAEEQLQREHSKRIHLSGKHYRTFSGHTDLVRSVFDDLGLSPNDKVNNLPFPSIGSLFKGRDDFLVKLRQTLGEVEHRGLKRAAAITGAPAAALYGLGGIGKTRAAIEYAHRYADAYTALLFVVADSPASLHQNLASLCGAAVLNLAEKDERETAVQVAAVTRWLRRNPGWFLILDNVDSEEAVGAVEELLGSLTGSGQVVITSRIARWGGEVEPLDLDLLDESASVAYLLESTARERRPEPDDEPQAHTLTLELGQLALALEQAAAYINAEACSFAQYVAAWSRRRDELLNSHDPLVIHYPRSVAITWLTSFQQLTEDGRRLLRILGWLAPDSIPRSLMEAGGGPFAAESEQERTQEERDELIRQAEKALANLRRYSLATLSADKLSFSVHRLVQDVTRRTFPEADKLPHLKQALRWVDDTFEGEPTDVRTWPVLEPLVPHAQAVASFADCQGVPEPTAMLMNHLGQLRDAKAQYQTAEPLFRRALAIAEKTNGPQDPQVAEFLNNLALGLKAKNKKNNMLEAESLLRRALAIEEQVHGPDHIRVATKINNLASLLRYTHREVEAEPLFRRALTINEATFGTDHPGISRTLNNLALLLTETNRQAEAEPLCRRVLSIDERAFGPDHPEVAKDLNNLAGLLQLTNRRDEAEPLFRRALAIDENAYGPDHPKIALYLKNLALLLSEMNRVHEAEPLLLRALAIVEKAYGPEHPEVAQSLGNLAYLFQTTNRPGEAESLNRRALAIYEKAYGPNVPNWILNNLGILLQDLKRFSEAEPMFRRAFEICEKVLAPNHPDTLWSMESLAGLLEATGRFEEAALLQQRILEGREGKLGPEHPDTLRSWNKHSYSLRKGGFVDQAEPIDRRVLAATEKVLGETHPLTLHRRNNLVLDLIVLRKLADARELLRENWQTKAESFANTTPRIAFLAHIVALLESRPNTPFLGHLKTLLTGPELHVTADVAVSWDIAYLIEHLGPQLPPCSVEFLTALVAAMNDRANLPALDTFPQWRDQPPIPLEAP